MKKIQPLIACMLFSVSVSAFAQAGPPPDGMPPPDGQMPGGRNAPAAPPFMQYETQLRDTFTDLRITAAQQPLWQTYENKVHALMADLSRVKTPALPTTQDEPALQKLQRQTDLASDRLTAMEEIVDAAKALYAVLDDRQKTVADRRLAATVPPLYSREPGVAPSNETPPDGARMGEGRRGERRRGPPQ